MPDEMVIYRRAISNIISIYEFVSDENRPASRSGSPIVEPPDELAARSIAWTNSECRTIAIFSMRRERQHVMIDRYL